MNEIKQTIENTIKAFEHQNFLLFIKHLLTLRDEVVKVDPENTDPGLVDLIMDENAISWAISSIGRAPIENDWIAAGYIAADLKEILENINKNG